MANSNPHSLVVFLVIDIKSTKVMIEYLSVCTVRETCSNVPPHHPSYHQRINKNSNKALSYPNQSLPLS